MKEPKSWLTVIGTFGLVAVAVALQWLWQYSKFSNGHGLFYYLSPNYGAYILTAIDAVVLVVLFFALKRDLQDGP